MFGLLRNHRLLYRGRRDVGGGVTAFAFTPEKGELRALPGQHGLVALSTTARKPFSLASAPEEDQVLIATSLRSGSAFKKRFAALREGDEISVRGPIFTYGQRFTIDDQSDPPTSRAVLLAQGVGITPFRSILAHHALTGTNVETSLVHVAADGHAFREDTEKWAGEAVYLDHAEAFRTAVSSAAGAGRSQTFYVAGAPAFVSSTTTLLRHEGVDPRRIRQDKYLFYKPRRDLADPGARKKTT